ncbi:hypothetical protein BUALT_Bualt06G0070500 [Buddleja alternifolia]|uniref:Uncharacterized protein n=1 Tax=Buddleja alternifolia TaxID=168488 RepID=A0AAV6XLQ6_9LAMI|nr:hypothetical protein BUALT_Bualt06G0070500 [Buddleja alternifolia]
MNIDHPSGARLLNEEKKPSSSPATVDSSEILSGNTRRPSDDQMEGKRKLIGSAYGPSLMNMLPKGRIPASGPSRRINNANN